MGPPPPDKNGRPLSVKQIATALQFHSATLSPMLKRLEALGLITRTRSRAMSGPPMSRSPKAGLALRQRALKIPPAVVARLGVGLTNSSNYARVLTRINAAALAAGASKRSAGTTPARPSISVYVWPPPSRRYGMGVQ